MVQSRYGRGRRQRCNPSRCTISGPILLVTLVKQKPRWVTDILIRIKIEFSSHQNRSWYLGFQFPCCHDPLQDQWEFIFQFYFPVVAWTAKKFHSPCLPFKSAQRTITCLQVDAILHSWFHQLFSWLLHHTCLTISSTKSEWVTELSRSRLPEAEGLSFFLASFMSMSSDNNEQSKFLIDTEKNGKL